MNILITGATGYIGKNILKRLLEEGHYCRCLVRKYSNIDFLKGIKNVELFFGDIAIKDTLTNICRDIDIIINSVGILGKWNSTIEQLRPVNANGIVNLAEEIGKNNTGYIVHLSAGGVTGPVSNPPADENYICNPQTPYEKTKWEGEKNAIRLFKEYKLPVVVVRPTFTYGPVDPHKLPLFRTIKKRRLVFIGSGESTVHPVYIDDLVSGIFLLLQKRPVGETFIIGGPRPVSKKELIGTIAKSLGVKDDFMHIPQWTARLIAKGMVRMAKIFNFEPILTPSRVSMMADDWGYLIKKAENQLGYYPKVDLEEGISITTKSYKDSGLL